MPTQAEISLNPMSSYGDILSHNGQGRIRIGIGTASQILTASSTAPGGVEWRSYGGVVAGNYDTIASSTTTASASTVTISNIPTTYTDLVIIAYGGQSSSSKMSIKINSTTATTASYSTYLIEGYSGVVAPIHGTVLGVSTGIALANNASNYGFANHASGGGALFAEINNYSNTSYHKTVLFRGNWNLSGSAVAGTVGGVGTWENTAAITSISLVSTSSSFLSGLTIEIYGLKRFGL